MTDDERSFRTYLRDREANEADWLEGVRRGDPQAFELHSAWHQAREHQLRSEGKLVEFNAAALEELGVSLDEWRRMTPIERLEAGMRWFGDSPNASG